jgi:hypothetical protein
MSPHTGREDFEMTMDEIVEQAEAQLVRLTRLKPDTVSSVFKDEGGWRITVEMIEMRRLPESGDLLATYDTHLDDSGNLVRYQRTRRYLRGETMEQPA